MARDAKRAIRFVLHTLQNLGDLENSCMAHCVHDSGECGELVRSRLCPSWFFSERRRIDGVPRLPKAAEDGRAEMRSAMFTSSLSGQARTSIARLGTAQRCRSRPHGASGLDRSPKHISYRRSTKRGESTETARRGLAQESDQRALGDEEQIDPAG